jgi:hypothetical protein
VVRGRVVVVVGGVMSTQGDGNTVYKAKDHSRDGARTRWCAAKRPHSKAGWNRPSLAKQWRPNPAEVRCIAATDGHEIKLAGETGEACGRVTLPIRARHGSRDGQTVIVESEILSIIHTYCS